ncbi:MAG: class I SAM-dependent methyltransferase [Methanobrevibacter sp.]|nr:class I SAM-dependent methyltransferase [Methanobrevibacter sp.]
MVINMEHKHHGKSSATFLNSDEIIKELNFKGNETFMDVGCGDGYISLKAIDEYLPEGTVYAVDIYDKAIEDLKEYKSEKNIENLIPIEADITKGISLIDDDSIDVILMLNVFHGFKESEIRADVIEELKRLIKNDGKIAIMEFKPIEMQKGPPVDIRVSHFELEELFVKHGLKKVYLNVDIGEKIPEGKSHYIIIFQKE